MPDSYSELEAEVVLLRERCASLLTALIDLAEAQSSPPIFREDGWQEANDNALAAIEDARSNDA